MQGKRLSMRCACLSSTGFFALTSMKSVHWWFYPLCVHTWRNGSCIGLLPYPQGVFQVLYFCLILKKYMLWNLLWGFSHSRHMQNKPTQDLKRHTCQAAILIHKECMPRASTVQFQLVVNVHTNHMNLLFHCHGGEHLEPTVCVGMCVWKHEINRSALQ